MVWSSLSHSEPVETGLNQSELVETSLNRSELVETRLNWPELIFLTKESALVKSKSSTHGAEVLLLKGCTQIVLS